MVNCEGALSDHGRQVGLNRTPERFALLMRNARIDLVNLGNNHTFDAEERGFSTRRALFHWPGLPMSAAELILPIPAGLMRGANGRQLLENLRTRSAALGTSMTIDGEKGLITVSQTSK